METMNPDETRNAARGGAMTTPEQIARETAEKKHVSMCFDCTRKLGFEKLWNDANTGTMGGTIGCELCGKSNWLRDIAIPAIERAIGGEEPKPTPTAEHITNEIVNTFNPWFLTRDDAKLLHKLILNALTQFQSRIAELEEMQIKIVAEASGNNEETELEDFGLAVGTPLEFVKHLRAKYRTAFQERDAAQQELGNLYAAIFRDGGQEYQRLGENSYDAAVEKVLGAYSKIDADVIAIDILKDGLEAAQQKVREVEGELSKLKGLQ